MRRVLPSFFLGASLLVLGCGSGDNPADPTVDANVAGTWQWVVANVTSNECPPEIGWVATVTITQTGTSVTASSLWNSDMGGPYVFNGTVSGNTLTIPDVTYPEDMGTTTATHEVVLQTDGTMFGTETWEWMETPPGTDECTGGMATVTANPQP